MIQHVDGEKKGKQMIKLIATDIDGTLVADGTLDLNPEYYDVIKELTVSYTHLRAHET